MMTTHQKGPQTARIGVADGGMFALGAQLDLPNPIHAARRLNACPQNLRTIPMPRPHPLPPVLTASGALLGLRAPLVLADQTHKECLCLSPLQRRGAMTRIGSRGCLR